MTKEYERRIVSVIVAPKGEPIYSELATAITIEDEAAGEFIKISQPNHERKLAFDREEWQAMRLIICLGSVGTAMTKPLTPDEAAAFLGISKRTLLAKANFESPTAIIDIN